MKILIETEDGKLTDGAYLLEKQSDKVATKFSVLGGWCDSVKGKDAYSLEDTGNGFVFRDCHSKKTFKLDYCQIRNLINLASLMGEKADCVVLEQKCEK